MEKVRVGIIGMGGIGNLHARCLASGQVQDGELAAVCDPSKEQLAKAAKEYGEKVKPFENVDALLASKAIDGVILATPHFMHPPLAIQAFEKGLHVLTEKPAGVYTKQVREMNQAAKQSGKVFGIMFQYRTHGTFKKIKDLAASGELGELIRVSWTSTSSFRSQFYYDAGGWRGTWAGEGGGTLINQGPHPLDVWQWICGMPKRMRAFCYFGKHHAIETEDEVTAFAEYPNGATGVFIVGTGEAPGTDRLELAGDNGKLVLEDGIVSFWRTRIPVSRFKQESKAQFESPEVWRCDVPITKPKVDWGGHAQITGAWVGAILKGTPLIVKGEEGLNSVELANAMLLSTWTDGWVDLPIDGDLFYRELQKRIKTPRFKG